MIRRNGQKNRNGRAEKGKKPFSISVLEGQTSGKKHGLGFSFYAGFSLCCIAIFWAINRLPDSYTRPINAHTASTLGLTLNLLGIPVSVWGEGVFGKGMAVKIISECTPLFMWGLFLSFVGFYPAPIAQKAFGLAAGIPALYLGNLLRLVLVFIAGRHHPYLFEIFHVYLGQVYSLALLLLVCILWLREPGRKDGALGLPVKPGAFLARLAAISLPLFIIWLSLNTHYIGIIDRLMAFIFSFFGYRLITPIDRPIFYETFNLVAFLSLILASRSIALRRKLWGLTAGVALLFIIHLFYRTSNLLVTGFQLQAFIGAMMNLALIGQYLLPILLWFAMVRLPMPNGLFIKPTQLFNTKATIRH